MNFDGRKNFQYQTFVFYAEKSDYLQVKEHALTL
jgi:hypothetical protein